MPPVQVALGDLLLFAYLAAAPDEAFQLRGEFGEGGYKRQGEVRECGSRRIRADLDHAAAEEPPDLYFLDVCKTEAHRFAHHLAFVRGDSHQVLVRGQDPGGAVAAVRLNVGGN